MSTNEKVAILTEDDLRKVREALEIGDRTCKFHIREEGCKRCEADHPPITAALEMVRNARLVGLVVKDKQDEVVLSGDDADRIKLALMEAKESTGFHTGNCRVCKEFMQRLDSVKPAPPSVPLPTEWKRGYKLVGVSGEGLCSFFVGSDHRVVYKQGQGARPRHPGAFHMLSIFDSFANAAKFAKRHSFWGHHWQIWKCDYDVGGARREEIPKGTIRTSAVRLIERCSTDEMDPEDIKVGMWLNTVRGMVKVDNNEDMSYRETKILVDRVALPMVYCSYPNKYDESSKNRTDLSVKEWGFKEVDPPGEVLRGFKVVRKEDGQLHSMSRYDLFPRVYKKDIWTRPALGRPPLSIFDALPHARRFVRVNWGVPNPEIWTCHYVPAGADAVTDESVGEPSLTQSGSVRAASVKILTPCEGD